MAAGVGSRLDPITREKPKTLVSVNDRPILGYILDALLGNGILDVILCTGFKADLIVEYCTSFYPNMKFTFVQNDEYASTNNMYSLYLAKTQLDDDILLMNADVVFDPAIIAGLSTQSASLVAVDKGSYNQESMKVIVDLTIVPIGVGVSLSRYVAACQRVLEEAELDTQLHANGTNIEGEWDVVFAAIRRCHEVLHEMGAPRISTVIKLGTRTDRAQTMQDKVDSVRSRLDTDTTPHA